MMNIAIDGPAGAGKSTIAKLVAKEKGYIYVDTGAMYRSIALYMIRNNVNIEDDAAIKNACDEISIDISYEAGSQQVYLNGENVSVEIRQEQVGNMASKVAAKPVVREKLLQLQRDLAAANNVVMDGRDIGTFVLPNANLKIYLTASVEARANRRYKELVEKGGNPDLEQIKADIEQRDYQDMNRDIAPLKQAEDAVYLDSSNMDINQVVQSIIDKINCL
ncbi:MAG: (d)CMP kinase [Lachnospiraceae bacterium]|nr:(d)CMP kinase [Lachnospiraceae bacterium]